MKADKIVFPTDFSHTGDAALLLACSLARDTGAKLLIIHVEEPPEAYGAGEMYYGMLEPPTEELRRMLAAVVPEDAAIEFEHHLITGAPAEGIARFAESERADLIVIGTHGRSGVSRLLMGSVAEAVVRQASCPVLTYRRPPRGQTIDSASD